MTDLEMTRLCAEAMGLSALDRCDEFGDNTYDPFYNDAQAMALVKKLGLDLIAFFRFGGGVSSWVVRGAFDRRWDVHRDDLNRAIVECVAKMQQAKSNA